MRLDDERVHDLAEFSALVVEGGDLEPWAGVLAHLRSCGLGVEETHWLTVLYNTYDDIGHAFAIAQRWPLPQAWDAAPDRGEVVKWMPAQERRNLRGTRVLRRFDSYLAQLDGRRQDAWLRRFVVAGHPERSFEATTEHLRSIWGVGRQAAFEWAEFLAKVSGFPLTAPDAQLWESEGPRRALERLGRNPDPSPGWLEEAAHEVRDRVNELAGLDLSWEDFETAICDYNVMRDGRYYPGKHLGMIREEIETITDGDVHRRALAAFQAAVPHPWNTVPPGTPKALQTQYRDTGRMVTEPWRQ